MARRRDGRSRSALAVRDGEKCSRAPREQALTQRRTNHVHFVHIVAVDERIERPEHRVQEHHHILGWCVRAHFREPDHVCGGVASEWDAPKFH